MQINRELLSTFKEINSDSVQYSKVIIIEDDSPVWILMTKYGIAIKREGGVNTPNKIFSLTKDKQVMNMCLWFGRYVLSWEGVEFTIEFETVSNEREIIKVYLDTMEQFTAFKSFLFHAREYSKHKSDIDHDKVIVNTLEISNTISFWKQMSLIPKRNADSIITIGDKVKCVLDDIRKFNSEEEEYDTYGLPYKRNYLLLGPPGCGKSSTITAIASAFNKDICFLNVSQQLTEKILISSINSLNDRSLLVIEDIDCICRSAKDGSPSANIILGVLTNILDGTLYKKSLITILTSSNSDILEGDIIRAGRIDYTCKFDYVCRDQVNNIVSHMFPSCGSVEVGCLCNRIHNQLDRINKVSSSKIIHFLFKYRNMKPEDIDEDVCAELSLDTKICHVNECNSNEHLYM